MQQDKKKREKKILNLIYSDDLFELVIPREEPDFELNHKNSGPKFGVEITEFYFSESYARINNIPGYVNKIINTGQRHREDISLEAKEFTVVPSDDRRSPHKIKAIIQEQPAISECATKIAGRINNKNKRYGSYINGLDHVNLIIFDYENRLVGVPANRFHYLFFNSQMEKALVDSDFREVFLITKIGSFQKSETVFLPLKMLFLIAEVYFFNFIIVKEYSDKTQQFIDKEPALVAQFLKWRGLRDVKYRYNSEKYEVFYGNSGIAVTKDSKISILDNNDYNLQGDFMQANDSEFSQFFDEKFLDFFNKAKKNYIFSTELHFKTRNEK